MADSRKPTGDISESDIGDGCQSLSISSKAVDTDSSEASCSDVSQPPVACDSDSDRLHVEGATSAESDDAEKRAAQHSGCSVSEEELRTIFNAMKSNDFPITSIEELRENFSEKIAEARSWARQRQAHLLTMRQQAEREHERVVRNSVRTEEQIRRACEMARAQVDNEYNELMSQLAAARKERVSRLEARAERLRQSDRMVTYYTTMVQSMRDDEEMREYMPALTRALARAREEHENIVQECMAQEREEEARGGLHFVPSDIPLDAEHLIGSFRVVDSDSSQDQ